MRTQVDKTPSGTQASRHIAHGSREIFHVRVEEHARRSRHRPVPHREMPGIGPDAGTEPPPGEPELVSREVKPYSAITRVCQDPPEAPGPARHIKAH